MLAAVPRFRFLLHFGATASLDLLGRHPRRYGRESERTKDRQAYQKPQYQSHRQNLMPSTVAGQSNIPLSVTAWTIRSRWDVASTQSRAGSRTGGRDSLVAKNGVFAELLRIAEAV
jgi:hypothetical protein